MPGPGRSPVTSISTISEAALAAGSVFTAARSGVHLIDATSAIAARRYKCMRGYGMRRGYHGPAVPATAQAQLKSHCLGRAGARSAMLGGRLMLVTAQQSVGKVSFSTCSQSPA